MEHIKHFIDEETGELTVSQSELDEIITTLWTYREKVLISLDEEELDDINHLIVMAHDFKRNKSA